MPDDAWQPVDTDESTHTDTDTDDGSTSEPPRHADLTPSGRASRALPVEVTEDQLKVITLRN